MKDRTNEDADTALAEELLFGPCGLSIDPIPREPGRSKTPDFKIISWRGFGAFGELKSPRDDWLDEKLEEGGGEVVGGARSDPVPNRLARHIKAADVQFSTANPDHEHPNVLVFVNHDPASHAGDLLEVLTGRLHADSGEAYLTLPHVAARVADVRIDLYLWIDAAKRTVKFLFGPSAKHHARLREMFLNLLNRSD
jgi:hypothetical protein